MYERSARKNVERKNTNMWRFQQIIRPKNAGADKVWLVINWLEVKGHTFKPNKAEEMKQQNIHLR